MNHGSGASGGSGSGNGGGVFGIGGAPAGAGAGSQAGAPAAAMASPPPPPAPPPFPPPQPLLTKESGNAVTNAAADVLDKAALPFQNLANPNMGAFDKAQGVVGAVAGIPGMLDSFLDDAFARATNGISKALPSFPAAVMGALVVGIPHTHTHPPSLIPPAPPIPLPAIGAVMTGCPSVLIGGLPAARSGDMGIGPTCGSLAPVLQIFTGSSKVFIGGARAARMVDLTKQCTSPPPGGGGGAAAKMSAGAKAMAVVGKVAKNAGRIAAIKKVITTQMAAAAADDASLAAQQQSQAAAVAAAADAKAKAAEASAAILAAGMMAANEGMGLLKAAMEKLMGKDPGAPPCIGAIMIGVPTVLIGGFPMPSWGDIAKGLKKLIAALGNGRRGGAAQGKAFCFSCM